MAKKNKKNSESLPAGMSRRQAKLAARAAERAALNIDPRQFRGFAAESDLIALREFVASATFDITTPNGVEVTVCSVLPGALPALRLEDEFGGTRMVGLQTSSPSALYAADLAASLKWVEQAAPGDQLQVAPAGENGAAAAEALAEFLPRDVQPNVQVHDDFNWWVPEGAEVAPQLAQGIQNANSVMMISRRLAVETGAVWWVDTREKGHVRWVRPESEEELFPALVRLHAAGQLTLGEGSRYAGMFRTFGVLVPVFDVDREQPAEHWQDAVTELGRNLEKALQVTDPFTDEERKSRNLLNSRQVTIR